MPLGPTHARFSATPSTVSAQAIAGVPRYRHPLHHLPCHRSTNAPSTSSAARARTATHNVPVTPARAASAGGGCTMMLSWAWRHAAAGARRRRPHHPPRRRHHPPTTTSARATPGAGTGSTAASTRTGCGDASAVHPARSAMRSTGAAPPTATPRPPHSRHTSVPDTPSAAVRITAT